MVKIGVRLLCVLCIHMGVGLQWEIASDFINMSVLIITFGRLLFFFLHSSSYDFSKLNYNITALTLRILSLFTYTGSSWKSQDALWRLERRTVG